MATLEKAIEIAARAHVGVTDKNGQPYILHPLRVMLGVDDPTARIVAVLHDVVEDTAVTFDELRAAGFGDDVLDSLGRVTHGDDESYADYVVRCRPDPIARAVKLSDLQDNWRFERLLARADRLDADFARIHRYALSQKFLTDQISEAEYREAMNRLG